MSEEDEQLALCQGRVGATLSGKWRLDALIGVGGMAAVYAATHRNGARAAIKILHADFGGHQEIRARFLREAYIANKVEHSGTVRVLDDDVSETGEPYLVMELLVGTSVESRAKKNGGWLRYPEVLTIVEQTLAVLEKAHSVGVVHRDLKPDNLFVTAKGELKVLDFGIARLSDGASSKKTQTGMMMGTPAYMAPEQALGRWSDVDGRTDLWSVGAVFFTLLAGRSVHEGQTDNEVFIRAATRPAPSLARVVANAPLEVVRVVDRALKFEQADRFPDANSMRIAVRELMVGAGVAPWGGAATAPASPAAVAAAMQQLANQVPPVSAGPVAVSPRSLTPAVSVRAVAPEPIASPIEATHVLPAPNAGGPRSEIRASRLMPAVSAPPMEPVDRAPGPIAQPRASAASGTFAGISLAALQQDSVRHQPRPEQAAFEVEYTSSDDAATLKELFTEIERALVAKTQYGPAHPEALRRADRAFRIAASGLMNAEHGLVWNVMPYAFVVKDDVLWEPQAPLDRVPYQLFADGVRVLGLVGGLDEPEFQAFLGLLTLDRATEVAPEDDFATLLWDAGFEHVVYQVVDTFADGDQQQRLRFEVDRERIIAEATADTTPELMASWQDRQASRPTAELPGQQTRMLALLSAGPVDAEAVARAQELRVAGRNDGPEAAAAVLHVDDAHRTMLAARLTMQTSGLSERFAVAVARACEEGMSRDRAASVTTPLRFAVDGLAKQNPELAIDMVGSLCREVGRLMPAEEGEQVRAVVAGAIVSKKMLASVLAGAKDPSAKSDVFAKGLRMILGYCDATYFEVVLGELGSMPHEELRDVLVEYLARHGAGRELEIGKLFAEADLELGLALVRLLAAIKSPAAREAIAQAARSPHPVVRIEALGHVEGVSSERLRIELRTLLEDREPGVRIAALAAMANHGIRVAGPFLVLRIRSEAFDSLSEEERRQAFQTLAVLASSRAESVALEVVKERRLVTSNAHEESRELAVELLGRIGTTEETHVALTEISTARFRNSDRVRVAAARALEAFVARASAPKRPTELPRKAGQK